MNVTTIGIDLAKHSFSLHGVDARGKTVFRKTLSRAKLLPFLAQQPPCLVGMEACSGAHHWGRQLVALGHRVGIMATRFVTPYRKGGKRKNKGQRAIVANISENCDLTLIIASLRNPRNVWMKIAIVDEILLYPFSLNITPLLTGKIASASE